MDSIACIFKIRNRSFFRMLVSVAACQLNQWALDFEGNYERSVQSFKEAINAGCIYRLGPELEICGYGCNDHFLENDTLIHCWTILKRLLEHSFEIIGDVGMPVSFRGVLYNCRVIFKNKRILLIRPKLCLANGLIKIDFKDGNYREMRYFSAWTKKQQVEEFCLPDCIREVDGQEKVMFGDGVIRTLEYSNFLMLQYVNRY